MRIAEVRVEHFRGWKREISWQPDRHALLVGPNNAGKTTLLAAIDLVLNPYRDAYRDRLTVWDYPDCDTAQPVRISVVLAELSEDDCDYFEAYLEGRRADGTFGGWDSPEEEFDQNELVLRLDFCGTFGDPCRAYYARPEANGSPVRQADKIRIGWHYIPAGMDPGHELGFYSNSVLARLFEQGDLAGPLDAIRKAINEAKNPLLALPPVAAARERLQDSAQRLRLAPAGDPLDLAVAGLSDRRVLQSLQLVMQGNRSPTHLPLDSHGRGVLRVLLLAALLQSVRTDAGNLILAVEEPEQNLEPVNQRLVIRSLLLAEDAGADQVLLTTHSAEISGTVPLSKLHLVREYAAGPDIRSLRGAVSSEHKFFERHARAALIDGLYATAVVLVEGPTERGALPVLWALHRPGDGLDEHRLEIIDCESIDKMPSFVRFYRGLGIPVIAVCDGDKPRASAEVQNAQPDAVLQWRTHQDWEGVLAAEAVPQELAAGMEECRATLGSWSDHAQALGDCLVQRIAPAAHISIAKDIQSLIGGYNEAQQRDGLACLLRGKAGLDFKSPIYARMICERFTIAPPTIVRAIDHIHSLVDGDVAMAGIHDL